MVCGPFALFAINLHVIGPAARWDGSADWLSLFPSFPLLLLDCNAQLPEWMDGRGGEEVSYIMGRWWNGGGEGTGRDASSICNKYCSLLSLSLSIPHDLSSSLIVERERQLESGVPIGRRVAPTCRHNWDWLFRILIVISTEWWTTKRLGFGIEFLWKAAPLRTRANVSSSLASRIKTPRYFIISTAIFGETRAKATVPLVIPPWHSYSLSLSLLFWSRSCARARGLLLVEWDE